MKLAKFFIALSAVEKGSAFVIKNHETGEITDVKPEVECTTKVGGLCIGRKTKKHNKKQGKEEDLTAQYGETKSENPTPKLTDMNPLAAYAITKDKQYIDLAMAGANLDADNTWVKYLAAKDIKTNPLRAYALTKDPLTYLGEDIVKDPTLAVHAAQNMDTTVTANDLLMNKFLNKNNDPQMMLALTGNPILAHGQVQGHKFPLYATIAGRPELAAGHVATHIKDPLEILAVTGDRKAMYAAKTKDPELSYTAQQMNNPTFAYALTGDPVLAIQKRDPNKSDHNDNLNPALAYYAAKSGDVNLAYALTGDAATAYAAGLPEADRTRAALAPTLVGDKPILTHLLTKDPVLTLEAAAHAYPDSPGVSYMAAMTKDPSMAMALTGNPEIGYAAQTDKPGLTGMAIQSENPLMAYVATKDKLAMAMASDDERLTQYAAAATKDPRLAYAVTGNVGTMYAAQNAEPGKAALYQQMGNPMLTYFGTKDPTLALTTGGTPEQPVNIENPLTTYFVTKDPVMTMLSQAAQPADQAPLPVNSPINYIAANSKDPMMSLVLSNNPVVHMASQAKNPTLALAATNMNNPAATYMVTKDPVLTMMSQYAQPEAPAAEPVKPNPMNTLLVSQMNNLEPGLAYGITGDPNMIMHGQWNNKDLALVNAMGGTAPVSTNPMMDMIAAQSVTDPTTSYALTGNPLIAHAVAAGKGKEVAGLIAGQSMNPMMTYAITKDPKLTLLASQQNPLLGYTALQHSPALAAVATNNPMLLALNP
jgi:uncharacterized membrane protein